MSKTQSENWSQANMSRLMKRARQLQPISAVSGDISTEVQPLGRLQAHSCLHPLQKHLPGHPDIGQRKQGNELSRVLSQPAIAGLAMTELAFDHPEWVLHFGSHTGLEFFSLFHECTPGREPLLFTLAWPHGNLPVHASGLISLGRALIASISEDNLFLSMQQCVPLGDIVDVGGGADNGMHQAAVSVHANMRFHSKVPLVALLGLMHFGVTFTGLVLGGAGRCDQRGINHSAGLEQQALGGEFGVDDLQNLRTQVVLFEQVSEPQNADPIGNALGATDTYEIAQKASFEQGLFGPQVGEAKPLLQTVNAQHHYKIKRWAPCLGYRCVRRYQCQQFTPRHDLPHLVEQDLFARSSRAQVKAKVGLFHAVIDCNLRASAARIEAEF